MSYWLLKPIEWQNNYKLHDFEVACALESEFSYNPTWRRNSLASMLRSRARMRGRSIHHSSEDNAPLLLRK